MLSKIVLHNGNYMFEIDGKTYIPAACRSFRPTPANISLFHRNGVKLYQMQCSGLNSTLQLPYSNYGAAWIGDHKYDFSVLDRQLNMFMKYAPDDYYMLMVQLDTPKWWLEAHDCPYDSYNHIGETYFIQEWIDDATDYLKAFIKYAEEHYGDRVFAYSFSAGSCTEWFDIFYNPVSEAKMAAYREYLGNPEAAAPTLADIKDTSLPSLKGTESNLYQFQKFCSELTPNLILHFADAAQSVLEHRKILGLFFGYSDCPIAFQNRTATNGYEKVWDSDLIDMFFSPASYGNSRLLGGSSSYQYTVDSLALHNKLYLHEIDHRTHLSDYPLDNFFFIGGAYETEYETIMVLRRELCATACKGGSLWWFDFMGGYYASPEMEAEIRHELDVLNILYQKPHKSVSEIAVFVDPMSFLHMKDETHMTMDCVRHNRDSLHECGAPFDYFNLNDILRIDPTQYKMFVYLNALEISEEVQQYIKNVLADKINVWVYAPNLYTGGIEQLTGIKPQNVTDPMLRINYKGIDFGFTDPTQPLFGDYIARNDNHIFIPCGNVPSLLWHDIAREAGVHLYHEPGGALYVDSRFVAYQTKHETDITLNISEDGVYAELFDGGEYEVKNGQLCYTAETGRTKLFMRKE